MAPRGWGQSVQGGRHDVRSNEVDARCRHIRSRGLGASTVHVVPETLNLETTCQSYATNSFDYPTELERHARELAASPKLPRFDESTYSQVLQYLFPHFLGTYLDSPHRG